MIIAHRGLWKINEEKNQLIAFEKSFSAGFGVETDIRDRMGELVISHDIPAENVLSADHFFRLYAELGNNLPLALNIKSDGLQEKLYQLLDKYNVKNYFLFDMSVPDALGYMKRGMPAFTRQSEYEEVPAFYDKAAGVWLDQFDSDWITDELVESHIVNNKTICIVSPELHGRSYENIWRNFYVQLLKKQNDIKVMLCTDYPEKMRRILNEQN